MSVSELGKAAEDLRGNRVKLCLQRMERLKQFNPYSIDYYINMGTVNVVDGKREQAVENLNKAMEYDPFDFRPYYNMFVLEQGVQNNKIAVSNLAKCMSILYTLNQQFERALQLWPANTAAHAYKIIRLIKQQRVDEANQAINIALAHCIAKHHIMAISGILDSRLSQKVEKQQDIRNHNPHLLYHISSSQQIQTQDDNSISPELKILVEQFNKINQLYASKNTYESYDSHPQLLFMKVNSPTSINIEKYITDNLGTIEPLSQIKQESNIADDDEKTIALKEPHVQFTNTNMKVQKQKQNYQTQGHTQQISNKLNQKLQQQLQQAQKQEQIQQQKQKQKQQQQPQQYKQKQKQKQNEEQKNKSQEMEIQKNAQGQQISTQNKQVQIQVQVKKQVQQEQKEGRKVMDKGQEVKKQQQKGNGNKKEESEKQALLYPVTHPNFEVKLVMADLQINQELVGKMDPYVYYEYGFQKHKSTIAKGQGLKPRWVNEVKAFSLERNPTVMKVSIYDREIFKWDDLVGSGEFEVVKQGLHKLPIYLKQKQTGVVVFYITKKP